MTEDEFEKFDLRAAVLQNQAEQAGKAYAMRCEAERRRLYLWTHSYTIQRPPMKAQEWRR